MTKLLSLRVVLAADDDALIGDVAARLRELVAAAGSERLDNADGPRVHWVSADVLQGVERLNTPRRAAGRRSRATGQGELAP